jgi:two-component system, chemotaxis family, chemotaxis protein CheY
VAAMTATAAQRRPRVDILLVDDDDDLRDVLGELLEECGYRVATASNGMDALSYLREHDAPSVVLLDLMMPVMDGATFREEQRRDDGLSDIPVFVLTARGETDGNLHELGAARVFRKPIALTDLLAAIQSVVER